MPFTIPCGLWPMSLFASRTAGTAISSSIQLVFLCISQSKRVSLISLCCRGRNHFTSMRMLASKTSRSEETLLFAKNFLQHPKMLGSLIPSSRFLVGRLLGKIDWERARTIVEYGPGVGTITAHILARGNSTGWSWKAQTTSFPAFLTPLCRSNCGAASCMNLAKR